MSAGETIQRSGREMRMMAGVLIESIDYIYRHSYHGTTIKEVLVGCNRIMSEHTMTPEQRQTLWDQLLHCEPIAQHPDYSRYVAPLRKYRPRR